MEMDDVTWKKVQKDVDDERTKLETASKENLPLLGGSAETTLNREVTIKRGTCGIVPEGVDWDLVLVSVDFALDLKTIATLVVSENYMFASGMIAIVGSSTASELKDFLHLRENRRRTLRLGIRTEGFMRLIDRETGFEAFYSFIITLYSLPFSVRTPFDMFTQIASILLSFYNLAGFVHSKIDLHIGLSSESRKGSAVEVEDR